MPVFQHSLWGYELTYPENWVHQSIQDTESFAPVEAFGAGTGDVQLLVRAEWNPFQREIEPLWTEHLGKTAGMVGARRVGSAPWRMGGGVGLEAEILLPKKENIRLWSGILGRGLLVIKMVVTHPRAEREQLEPVFTQLVSSLKFSQRVNSIQLTPEGIPLPPGYTPADPFQILADIEDLHRWRAYSGESGVDALQAFYVRELQNYDWEIREYIPFPAPTDLGFARLLIRQGERDAVLGIMPYSSGDESLSPPAQVVIKYDPLIK